KHDRLSKPQVALLRRWIESGAPWPDAKRRREILESEWERPSGEDGVLVRTSGGLSDEWTFRRYQSDALWAYRVVSAPEVPWSSLAADQDRHAIDAFISRRLRRAELEAAPAADRRSLLRRVSLSLTGLPPTTKETESFLAGTSEDAYSKLVDRLLDSPQYGVRMAQHWLDVTRHADSDGFSRDTFRPDAWKYRDWVVTSFNADKPYDRFVVEQLAADELKNTPSEVQSPLGFLWRGPWEHTAMSVAAVTRQLWLDDVTNSVGVTFLASELRCARCHDHKFDPIPTRDYYRVQAVFASTQHQKGFGKYEIRPRPSEPSRILLSGSLDSPGDQVFPGVLSAVTGDHRVPKKPKGRRRSLAEWIASPENPLTARVIVNRVWQWHFGRGLVATPNNFGQTGSRPTHPKLLDWLTKKFVADQWSLKKLHRRILTSATYRRSSRPAHIEKAKTIDPTNELLSHFSPRRLSVEELRDSMLAVTGELNLARGGPSVYPEIHWEVAFQPRLLMGKLAPPYEPDSRRKDRNRRSLYAARLRGLPNPFLEVLNHPGTDLSCERRDETTVTPQAFTLLHGEFTQERALALADRAFKESETLEGRIASAYRLAYGRAPSEREATLSKSHVLDLARLH
ncbi:MAG: DUF1549 and DUF1553 domain-containing protein, partial [Planctomycetota bacterium]